MGGHTPTAYFKDKDGNVVDGLEIGDKTKDEVLKFFDEHGFSPILRESVKSEL